MANNPAHSNRKLFYQDFAQRLNTLLIQKGYISTRSITGVKVSELATAAHCSHQMARRYALGEALPDYDTILRMANWLSVSPGWLLFGTKEAAPPDMEQHEIVGIDVEMLKHILMKCAPLWKSHIDPHELVSFILEIIYDATHLKAKKETILKMVNLAISSAERFSTFNNSYDTSDTSKNNKVIHG